jgi:outer membrane receptor protein involved in Fe transport
LIARFGGETGDAAALNFDHQFESDLVQYTIEAQQIWEAGDFRTVAGINGRWGDLETSSFLNDPTELPVYFNDPAADRHSDDSLWRMGAYLYETWSPLPTLQLTAGVAYDQQEFPLHPRSAPLHSETDSTRMLLPKAGVQWQPWRGGRWRAGYAQSATGGGFNPVLQLEPTHVAGFIQGYRSVIPEILGVTPAGQRIETFGIGFQQELPTRTFLSITGDWIEHRAPLSAGVFYLDFDEFGDLLDFAQPGSLVQDQEYRERALTVTADQLLGSWFTVGIAYRLQSAEYQSRHPLLEAFGSPLGNTDQEAVLHQITPHLTFNHRSGVFARFQARWWSQDNQEQGGGPQLDDTQFWQLDAWAGYRFRRRQAEFAVGLLNLLDEDYRLNPLNAFIAPARERTLALRLGLRF